MPIVPRAAASPPFILSIDIGTSSVRALVFDGRAHQVQGLAARREYRARTTPDGGSELDAEATLDAFSQAIDDLLSQCDGIAFGAVAASSLAASLVGVDADGKPVTPIYLYSDTRSAAAAERLRQKVDWAPIYERTGCPLHTSYLPAQFSWLKETRPGLVDQTPFWLSLYDFLLFRLYGRRLTSLSLASWTGLLNRRSEDWDTELLNLLGVRAEQLSPIAGKEDSLIGLQLSYRERWPALVSVPFYPAIGDGAAANLGSGCSDAARLAITVGTSGALRVVLPANPAPVVPAGLWLYSVDERRALMGGSLNNGGNVYEFLHAVLRLPEAESEERELMALPPDSHGLSLLPFFAGERSPGYHAEARGVIAGLHLASRPIEILQATLEAVAFRFASIQDLLEQALPRSPEIIASGSALLHSPAWVQILAGVLDRPITLSGEAEASARGAALAALERLGAFPGDSEIEAELGPRFEPDAPRRAVYRQARARHEQLYRILLDGQGPS